MGLVYSATKEMNSHFRIKEMIMVERYLKREVICKDGHEYNISTTSADIITWMGCYVNGYRPPKYPPPAPLHLAMASPLFLEAIYVASRSDRRE